MEGNRGQGGNPVIVSNGVPEGNLVAAVDSLPLQIIDGLRPATGTERDEMSKFVR
jgi:hypothetical protein